MNIRVTRLSKEEQEDFILGNLIKEAVAKGESRSASVEKIINKWK